MWQEPETRGTNGSAALTSRGRLESQQNLNAAPEIVSVDLIHHVPRPRLSVPERTSDVQATQLSPSLVQSRRSPATSLSPDLRLQLETNRKSDTQSPSLSNPTMKLQAHALPTALPDSREAASKSPGKPSTAISDTLSESGPVCVVQPSVLFLCFAVRTSCPALT